MSSKKIDKLTPEQEAKIPLYKEKWLKVGLNTDRINRPKLIEILNRFYEVCGFTKPDEVRFFDSPFAMQQEANKLNKTEKNYYSQLFCTTSAYWCSTYDFIKEELLPEEKTPIWDVYKELCPEAFWIIPFDKMALVSEKPLFSKFDEQKRLHCTDGPAIKFADGYSLYALNGRRVPEFLVMTPAEQLTKEQFAEIKNTEIRREFIRKVGILNAVKMLGGVTVDSHDYSGAKHFLTHEGRNYDLIECDFGTGGKRKYLKMKNASTADYHVEAVHPDCKTVDQALGYREGAIFGEAWREKNFKYEPPIVLT